MLTPFDYTSALDYLSAQIDFNKGVHRYKSQLAKAAQCQLSYLSQVLSEKALLNSDHAAGLAEFWRLSDLESEFFLDLVSLARAGTPALRQRIQARLEKAKAQNAKLSARIAEAETFTAPGASYYSAWYYTAIHILLGIPGFQRETEIADRLGLSIARVRQALETLQSMKLVEQEGAGKWRLTKSSVHIDRTSALHQLNHSHWRVRSIDAVEKQRDLVSYTGIHSLSRGDLETLKKMTRDFLLQTRKLIKASPEEELVCLNCDLFLI